MAETLISSTRNGGGMERPPAPPEGGDDLFAELGGEEGDSRMARERLLRLSPFIADLSLHAAVFAIDRPIDNPVMPWLNRFNARNSAN